MNILVTDSDPGVDAAAVVRDGIESGVVRVLGVATGSSPLPLYRELAARPPRRIDEVEFFALDEYLGLPAGHPQSYRSFLERELMRPLGLDPARLHVLDGTAADGERECAGFERTMAAAGGVDLQILGIGSNGHIGFNEPGSSPLSRTRVAALSARTRTDNARFFAGTADEVPTHCLTQGLATILEARRIVLVASGRQKAEAIAHAVDGPLDTAVPASLLRDHPDVTLVLDREAASMLTTEGVNR
jgi:glucosamine-6-phosphate deaminase